MSTAAVDASAVSPLEPLRPTRLWPPVALVALYWTVFAATGLADISMFHKFMGRFFVLIAFTLLYVVWWLASRRLPLGERFLVLGASAVIIAAVCFLMHPSLRGLQLGVAFYAVPAMFSAWTLWLLMTRQSTRRTVRRGLVTLTVLAWIWSLAVRTDGLGGQASLALHGRWTPTGEEKFLAEHKAAPDAAADNEVADGAVEPLVLADGDWPEFRGAERDGAVHGVKLATNWNESPPKLLWNCRIGPGWSSIVVIGNRLFTQEQRGPNEAVVCYDADSGEEVWVHEDKARFSEAMGGDGPRATPTFAEGHIYALGANGILNCLDAATGKPYWSHDISKTGQDPAGDAKAPIWGYCSSPLVVAGKVIVFAGGGGDYSAPNKEKSSDVKPEPEKKSEAKGDPNTLLAYDAQSGDLAWRAPAGDHSYTSPQLAEFDGQQHVLFVSNDGLKAYDPDGGKVLWDIPANADRSQSIPSIQPHWLGDARLLVSFNGDAGLVRASVAHEGDGWQVKDESESNWTGRDLKPFFNDFVRTGDALYGFDGSIFASIDAKTGKRNWKKGRYGSGQVLLVADQPVLVVISETGEAVLVAADPKQHKELGRFQAIQGKTWNHPTIAHGRLYVRNAEEMACYELQLAK